MSNQNCSDAQREANRANAQHSTGPRTEVGKQASSGNATRHALTGHRFTLRYDESEAEYNQVLHDLIAEHRPATTTEDILVVKLAQSYWLAQRAIRIASADEGDRETLKLMLRYQALHDRAFQCALRQLGQLRKQREIAERDNSLETLSRTFDLDLKAVRLEMLRSKQQAQQQRDQLHAFRRDIQLEIDDIAYGPNPYGRRPGPESEMADLDLAA